MSNMKKTVNMEIPLEHLDKILVYMSTLDLDPKVDANITDQETKPMEEEPIQYEVSSVSDHRILEDRTFQFYINWVNGVSEWVDDHKCNCEKLISVYLNRLNTISSLNPVRIHTAYLFCRVSTKEQATCSNLSLQAQEAELRETVAIKVGYYQRIRVYSISKSAYIRIPDALARIGDAALADDCILVWRVDRLSRNIVKYLEWLENINTRGVMIYSLQEDISYKNNKLAFIQAVLNSNKEAMILGERVKLAYKHKRARGDEKIGRLRYGKKYKREGTRMIVVENPDEQKIIYRICNTDNTNQEMSDILNRERIKKNKRVWNKIMVSRIRRLNRK